MSKFITINDNELVKHDKWLINFFFSESKGQSNFKYPLVQLRDIISERKESIEPQKFPEWLFFYLGLENVESNTGFLINHHPIKGSLIKSRSKVFYSGDILYGKLRPNLNKVFIADEEFKGGICSTEFFVFKINEDKMKPYFLRFILTSNYVLDQVKSFTAGAALPRIHIDDFLNIEIPLPEIKEIKLYELKIKESFYSLLKTKEILNFSTNYYNEEFENLFIKKNQAKFNINSVEYEGYSFSGGLPI